MPTRHISDELLRSTLTPDEIMEVMYGTPERANKLVDKALETARLRESNQ